MTLEWANKAQVNGWIRPPLRGRRCVRGDGPERGRPTPQRRPSVGGDGPKRGRPTPRRRPSVGDAYAYHSI
jgi:hypothetical protein